MAKMTSARNPIRLLGLLIGMACGAAGAADMAHAIHGAADVAEVAVAAKDLKIEDCWIRSMPAGVPSAGYFVVVNTAARPAVLQGIESKAYGSTMLHATQTQGGMSKMVMIHAVTVPANGRFVFQPGGHHAMLEKPTATLAIGSDVAFDFLFAAGVRVPASCKVRSPGALGAH